MLADQNGVKTLFHQLLPGPRDGVHTGVQRSRDLAVSPPVTGLRYIGFQQDAGLRQLPCRMLAGVDQGVQLLSLLRAEPHDILLDGDLSRDHESAPTVVPGRSIRRFTAKSMTWGTRRDWDGFVCNLVSDLAKEQHRIWTDQDFIVGGDDWMDAIGQALQICDMLLLILSPGSINSKYVKMEYRYFVRQNKIIIPILYRNIDQMPFEIATLNHIDFTRTDRSRSYQDLVQVLSRRRLRSL